MTAVALRSALKELPDVRARLSDGTIAVGSREHFAVMSIVEAIESMRLHGLLTKKEEAALLGIIQGMTAPQSMRAHGGKSIASVHKLRERSLERIRKELDEQ